MIVIPAAMRAAILAIAAAAWLTGCGAQDPKVKLLTGSRWAKTAAACSQTYVSFDRSRIEVHHGAEAVRLLDIVQANRDQSVETAIHVSGRATPVLVEAMRNEISSVEPGSVVTIGFVVTDSRMIAFAAVAGDKGEIGGRLRPGGRLYRLFDLVRCAA